MQIIAAHAISLSSLSAKLIEAETKVEEVVEIKEEETPKKSKRPNRGTSKRTRTKKTSEEKVEE